MPETDLSRAFQRVEVFRAGDYGHKGKFTPADLDKIVAAYDPKHFEAPVTIDHAQSGPASGWVAGLEREGRKLFARMHGVLPAFAEQVKAGAYKTRSVEIMGAGTDHRQGDGPKIRAVSFLGAASPHVKGGLARQLSTTRRR